jgi:hypothetical protein
LAAGMMKGGKVERWKGRRGTGEGGKGLSTRSGDDGETGQADMVFE